MQYDPKDASSAIPAGVYEATVTNIVERKDDGSDMKDKNGYDMMRVSFDVYVGDATRKLSQYFSAGPSALWRVKKMAEAVGLSEKFKAGKLVPGDFLDKNLRLTLAVKDDPKYGEQNEIKVFEPTAVGSRPPQAAKPPGIIGRVSEMRKQAAAIPDSEIPF
jgi:hypothetical protein